MIGKKQTDRVDVFISYCGVDIDVALTIANELTRWGVTIWIDQLEIQPGALLRPSSAKEGFVGMGWPV